jgi:hypothetical protein
LVNREERRALGAELAEIESDLVEQLLEVYRRGTSYDEFWELVERVRAFGELRKNFTA